MTGAASTAALAAVALVAGTVDAIAGGGGLLTLPALLFVGVPPQVALGTNKGQSVFGAFSALVRYRRAGMIDAAQARASFPFGLVGSVAGAALVSALSPAVLRPVVLGLLAAVAAVLALRPPLEPKARVVDPRRRRWVVIALAFGLGAYDGFFGPGVGTFLIIAFSLLLGTPLTRASADAKVVNFASNLAAVALFSARGAVLWRLAVPMAAAQIAGGWIGAHVAVRQGDRFVRWIVLAVVLAAVARLAWDWI